jgi:hypothetical protein
MPVVPFRLKPIKDLWRTVLVLGHRNGLFFRNFTVPRGRVFAFAEFLPTAATTQATDVVPTRDFSDYQIVATLLAVQVAIRVDTCSYIEGRQNSLPVNGQEER